MNMVPTIDIKVDVEKVIEIVADSAEKVVKELDGFGFIHERKQVFYKNKKGDLVWDYILYNEISFVPDEDPKSIERLFSSISDKNTKKRYNELYEKYKISK